MGLLSGSIGRIPASQTIAITNLARELRAEGRDIIGMSTGEPDFPTVPAATEGAMRAIEAGETRYTAPDGTPELKDAIIHKFARDNGLSYAREEISVGAGGKQVIYNALAVTLEAGDEVVVPVPYWVSYPVMVSMCGGTPVHLECRAEAGFGIDPDDLRRVLTDRTKWLLLNFPNNPTGASLGRRALEGIAEVLRDFPRVHVLTDDIYELLQFTDEPFATLAQVAPDLKERVLTVNGVSKGFAMTGWRIGYAGGPAELIGAMAKLQSQTTSNPCSIAQAAAAAALRAAPDHAASWREEFVRRRDVVVSAMNALDGVRVGVPEGAFYAFPDVTGLLGRTTPDGAVLTTAGDVATHWLSAAGVVVVPGEAFGRPGHVRISYSIARDQVEEAMARVTAACEALRPVARAG